MRLVIEHSEFKRLSSPTQRELLEAFADGDAPSQRGQGRGANLLWRQPFNLTMDLATRLIHGLSEPHKVRLRALAEHDGRISQKDLLAATGDGEMRVLSHFQSVLSRRLRRFIDDPEKKAHLVGWDFEATVWNDDGSEILDGIYYVTGTTNATLRDYFEIGQRRTA